MERRNESKSGNGGPGPTATKRRQSAAYSDSSTHPPRTNHLHTLITEFSQAIANVIISYQQDHVTIS